MNEGEPDKVGTVYDGSFYDHQVAGSLACASVVLPLVFGFYKPTSVVDVGCGRGAWLRVAYELGVPEIMGADGKYIEPNTLLIDRASFRAADLEEPFSIDRRFDLAISVEVAEHLSQQRSESFIADLTRLSDLVLFSAALPYQGGTNHINEQWLEYWGLLFRRQGYVACDVLRPLLWGDPTVEFWYSQNLMLFCQREMADRIFPPQSILINQALSRVHPLTFLVNAVRYRPLMNQAIDAEYEDYDKLLRAFVSGSHDLPPLQILHTMDKNGNPVFPEARTRISDADGEISALRGEVERLQVQAAGWCPELECLNSESKAEREQAVICGTESQRRIDSLSDEVAMRDQTVAHLRAQLAAQAEEIAWFQAAVDNRDRDLAQLRAEVADRDRQIVRLNADLSEQADKFVESNAHIAQLSSLVNARARARVAFRRAPLSSLIRMLTPLSLLSTAKRREREAELIAGSGLFDRTYYLLQHPELSVSNRDPLKHYIETGAAAGDRPNRLFDTKYYTNENPDVKHSGMNPLAHYIAFGAAEGRKPHPEFHTSFYLTSYQDVAESGLNPLAHYLVIGAMEGRITQPVRL